MLTWTPTHFLRSLQIIYKVKVQTSEVDMGPSEICDRIFDLVDQNHDGKKSLYRNESLQWCLANLYSSYSLCFPGQITLSEFMEGAQKDEWLMNMLKLDINVTGWVNQNSWKKSWPCHLQWTHCPLLSNSNTDPKVWSKPLLHLKMIFFYCTLPVARSQSAPPCGPRLSWIWRWLKRSGGVLCTWPLVLTDKVVLYICKCLCTVFFFGLLYIACVCFN